MVDSVNSNTLFAVFPDGPERLHNFTDPKKSEQHNMSKAIRILHLEDSKFDAEIAERELKISQLNYERIWVINKEEFERELRRQVPDIILSDHSLPSFSSVQAFKLVRDMGIKVPFILITGTISEEFAVSMMLEGAADYLLKDRMQRLPAAILNALSKFEAENEKQAYYEEVVSNEHKFRALIENISDAIILIDHNAKFVYQSPSVGRITGYAQEELDGKTVFDLMHPDDVEGAITFFKEVYQQPGVTRQNQYRVITKDGRVIWLEGTITNMLADTSVQGFIVNYRDITQRKLSEQATLEVVERLRQRNNDLRQFAYIVSHDLRAPIAKIQGLVSLMESEKDESSKVTLQQYITDEANHLDQVVMDMNEIVTASDSSQLRREEINFANKLESIKKVLEKEIAESNAQIFSDFHLVPSVHLVKSYMYSIMFNLLSNAIKYRLPERRPEIYCTTSISDDFVCLEVKDNGMGMDMVKNGERIFDLYRRIDSKQNNGRGIGLYLVKLQVESMGGRIEVESTLGVGSTFRIYIPVN